MALIFLSLVPHVPSFIFFPHPSSAIHFILHQGLTPDRITPSRRQAGSRAISIVM